MNYILVGCPCLVAQAILVVVREVGFIRSTDRYSTSKVGVTRQVAKEGKKSRALRCPIYCHKYSGGEGKSKKVTPYGCTKNGNHFQIIFAHHIFLSSNTGLLPKAPRISSLEVSEIAYLNVSLKCKVGVRPSDCWDNSLRWYFNNNSETVSYTHLTLPTKRIV